MAGYLQIHPYTIVGFLACSLLIALGNSIFIRKLERNESKQEESPFVSILVPARNEALNIERCVRSLLAQEYPAFEVIVLDDHSTDETPEILNVIQQENPALHVMNGEPLPTGWLGTHWACHQMVNTARGELLLFTDADTRHESFALRDSVAALNQSHADLLTAFPHEQVISWSEKLTVPVLAFAPFSFIPTFLARWCGGLAVTIGQFMLFRRSAHEAIGGYEAVRSHPLDDVKFGRLILKHGLRWLLVDGTQHVHCRMYRDFHACVAGFTRSLFAFFTHRVPLYVLAWAWIGLIFLEPPLVLLLHGFGFQVNVFPAWLAWIAVLEAIVLFSLIYWQFKFPMYLIWFYPLSVSLFVWLAFRSLIASLTGKAGWKDRALPSPRPRL